MRRGEPDFIPEDWEVFTEYGRTMYSLQEFEEALILAPSTETPITEKLLDNLFRMSAGQLKGLLERTHPVPEDLIEEMRAVLRRRNGLAHSFLTRYVRARIIDSLPPENAKAELEDIREAADRVTARLDQWSNELHQRGRLARVERNMRASPEEQQQRAKAMYDDLCLHMELGYLHQTGLDYDPEHDRFRFSDGGFAVSRTDADWMGLLLRAHVGL